jgi:hypothetical protein
MAFSLCPLAFFKGATMILYQHNNREQYGIGKIVATSVFALMFSLPHPSTLSPSKVLKKNNGINKRNFKKDITPQRFDTFSAMFLRVAEKSQLRAFFARSTYQR